MRSGGIHLGLLSVALATWACATPEQYPQANYYEGYPKSYYNNPNSKQSQTERIETLGQPRKRVVVLDFWNDTPVPERGVGEFSSEELKRGLHLTRRIIVPLELKSHFRTRDFVEGERIRVAQLIREGKRLGVAVLVIGKISKIVLRHRGDDVGVFRQKQSLAAVEIEIKMFDVAGGREIMATGVTGEASSNAIVAVESGQIGSPEHRAELTKLALRNAVAKLVPFVVRSVEKMTWEGRIAKIVGTKVYLNAGRKSGLVGGDILRVLTKGDDVYDPETGAYLGHTPGQLKGTLEISDFIGDDAAIAQIHTGGNFKPGDAVRLY